MNRKVTRYIGQMLEQMIHSRKALQRDFERVASRPFELNDNGDETELAHIKQAINYTQGKIDIIVDLLDVMEVSVEEIVELLTGEY